MQNPAAVRTTPSIRPNTDSVPQKQFAANVAVSSAARAAAPSARGLSACGPLGLIRPPAAGGFIPAKRPMYVQAVPLSSAISLQYASEAKAK